MPLKAVVCKKEKPNYTTMIILSLFGSLIASAIILIVDRATSTNLRTEIAELKYQVSTLQKQ